MDNNNIGLLLLNRGGVVSVVVVVIRLFSFSNYLFLKKVRIFLIKNFLLLIKIIMEWLYQVTAAAVVVVPWWNDLDELFDFFNEELLPCCWSCWTCSLFFNTAYTLSTWLSFSRRGMRSSNSRSSISSNQEEQGTWKMRVSKSI